MLGIQYLTEQQLFSYIEPFSIFNEDVAAPVLSTY